MFNDPYGEDEKISTKEIRAFFHRLNQLDADGSVVANTFFQSFSDLKRKIIDLEKQAVKDNRRFASEFNIFVTLGVDRDEVQTHSALLAHLLDPGQSHGQGTLFLHSFLQLCASRDMKFPRLPVDLDNGFWEVIPEFDVRPYGRVDIMVRNRPLQFLLVIENKVDASEQDNQLANYGKWLMKQTNTYPKQGLVFLTPSFRIPTTSGNTSVLTLSYHEDIYQWLKVLYPKIKASNVSEIIKQYIALVKSL